MGGNPISPEIWSWPFETHYIRGFSRVDIVHARHNCVSIYGLNQGKRRGGSFVRPLYPKDASTELALIIFRLRGPSRAEVTRSSPSSLGMGPWEGVSGVCLAVVR